MSRVMKAALAWWLKFIVLWRAVNVSESGGSEGRWEDEGGIDVKE